MEFPGRKKVQISKIEFSSSKYKKINSEFTKGKDYVYDINERAWKNNISFMSFCDLKEVGKVNKLFNLLSKQDDILIQFFKNRNRFLHINNSTVNSNDNTMCSDNQKKKKFSHCRVNVNSRLSQQINTNFVVDFRKDLRIPSFGDFLSSHSLH